jgi:hypothetical protein
LIDGKKTNGDHKNKRRDTYIHKNKRESELGVRFQETHPSAEIGERSAWKKTTEN